MKEIFLPIKAFFPLIKDFFELLGIFVVTVGSLFTMCKYLVDSIFKIADRQTRFVNFRISLTRFISTGLELIIIADLVNTTIDVNYYRLGMLLILVLIRTIIGYFLNKDLEVINLKV